jgi:hypothetical protein
MDARVKSRLGRAEEMMPRFLGLLLVTVCALAAQTGARDLVVEAVPAYTLIEKRHALVIGNDRYPSAPLLNAGNDARSVEQALSELGFQTLLLENAGLEEMDRGIKKFMSRIRPGDVALIFYAGHGFQMEGENYLVPVDFSATDANAAKFSSYSANKLLDGVAAREPKLQLVILDACRNNPFAVSRSLGGGLAMMGAGGKGTFIALATAPGATASDNPNGSNGLFTGAVLKSLQKKGLALTELFDEVKREVSLLSGDTQRPWTNSDFAGRWYFVPPEGYVPEEVDPATSFRVLDEARKSEKNQFYEESAGMYERLAAQEKDSELGTLAKSVAAFLRALVKAQVMLDGGAKPLELGAEMQKVWELLPSRASIGLEAATNYLLAGKVAEAITILGRLRGGDADTAFRATEMLQELAKTFPLAAELVAKPFAALPPDPMQAKPKSRFESLAVQFKEQLAQKRKEEAAAPKTLIPISGLISALPPPTGDGWLLRIETLKPAAAPPQATPPSPPPAPNSGAISVGVAVLSASTSAAGAQTPTQTATVVAAEAAPAAAKIVVEFQSMPVGASVKAGPNGEAQCTTPCTLELSEGPQLAVLTKDGFRSLSRNWEVSASQKLVAVELEPLLGTVKLATEPEIAQVELDGKIQANSTPTTLSLPPGDYVVSLWEGRIRVKQLQKFTVKDGESISFTMRAR